MKRQPAKYSALSSKKMFQSYDSLVIVCMTFLSLRRIPSSEAVLSEQISENIFFIRTDSLDVKKVSLQSTAELELAVNSICMLGMDLSENISSDVVPDVIGGFWSFCFDAWLVLFVEEDLKKFFILIGWTFG